MLKVFSFVPLSNNEKTALLDELRLKANTEVSNEILSFEQCEYTKNLRLPTADSIKELLKQTDILKHSAENVVFVQPPHDMNMGLAIPLLTAAASVMSVKRPHYLTTWSYTDTFEPQEDILLEYLEEVDEG